MNSDLISIASNSVSLRHLSKPGEVRPKPVTGDFRLVNYESRSLAGRLIGGRYHDRFEGAMVQVHGVGPWAINYVNPADDPRKK